jgi:hypothetical protein
VLSLHVLSIYRPTTWQNGELCNVLQIGNPLIRMQATSDHCPLLVPADAEWRCLNPDATGEDRIGRSQVWMDGYWICVSVRQAAPFSQSHAQEPGCHIVLSSRPEAMIGQC